MADGKKTAGNKAGKNLPPAPARAKSGGPIAYIREIQREMSKVTWPTWKETWLTSVVVLIMVAFTMMFFLLIDMAFGAGVRWLIGA